MTRIAVSIACATIMLAACELTVPRDGTTPVVPDPLPPDPYAWIQGQWYAEQLDLTYKQEVLSCTGRFVRTLSCWEGEQVSRGPGYMHLKQDTTTGGIAAALEYFVKAASGDGQVAGDLGISDTVKITITVDGPYFSSLPALAGIQPRGLPAEFDLEWIGMNWTLSPHGTDKALTASMSLIEGEGIRLIQHQTLREEFADSTGSYNVRFTSSVEALFVPTHDHLWPGHYIGTWTAAGGRTDRATVTLSHFVDWDKRPHSAHLTAFLHSFAECENRQLFQASVGGAVFGTQQVAFGTTSSTWRAGCPSSTSAVPMDCPFPADHETFRMTMDRETRTVDMYMILDCGELGTVRVDLEDADMNGRSWDLYDKGYSWP